MPSLAQAIVIGGSIAGLATARVLSDHFDRVTVLDRDNFPQGVGPRKGVPQARHIHILLARGKDILEGLFPGLQNELGRAGAPWVNVGTELAWFLPGGWKPTFHSPIEGRASTRDLFESTIRARVRALPNVSLVEGADVTGLLHEGGRVTGVRYRHRDGTEGEDTMRADLVVDAGGRASKAPQWLESLGYPAPEQTIINSFLGYATRFYQPPEGFKSSWKTLIIHTDAPAHQCGGVLLPVEGNRWVVTLGGMGKHYPPTDDAGFLEFARALRSPLLYDAIKRATPLSDIAGYRRTENRLNHYERLRRRPENFVLLGDAVCAFNPIYGQGMTTGTLGALALGQHLTRHTRRHGNDLAGLAARFQKTLARVNTTPWLLATGEDFKCPITEGGKPSLAARLSQGYFNRVLARATTDRRVCQSMLDVTHLLKHPATLFKPGVLWRAIMPPGMPSPTPRQGIET